MALNKATIPILVNGSIDTKTDNALVAKEFALEQINTDFDEVGAIKKICGTTVYSDDVDTGESLSDLVPVKLISHKNQLLCLVENGSIYSYRGDLQKWQKVSGYEKILFNSFIESRYSDQFSIISSSHDECPSKNFRVIAYVISNEKEISPYNKLVVIVEDYETLSRKVIYQASGGNSSGIIPYNCKVNIYDDTNPVIFLTIEEFNFGVTSSRIYTIAFYRDGSLVSGSGIEITAWEPNFAMYFETLLIENKLLVICPTNFVGVAPFNSFNVRLKYVITDGLSISAGVSNDITSTYANVTDSSNSSAFDNFDLLLSGDTIYYSRVIKYPGGLPLKSYTITGVNKDTLSVTFAEITNGATSYQCGKCVLSEIESGKILSVYSYNIAVKPFLGYDYYADNTNAVVLNVATRTFYANNEISGSIASKLFSIDDTTNRYYIAQVTTPLSTKYVIEEISFDNSYKAYFTAMEIFANYNAISDDLTLGDFGADDRNRKRNWMLPSIKIGKDGDYYFPAITISRQMSYAYGAIIDYDYIKNISLYKFKTNYRGFAELGGTTIFNSSMAKEYDGNKIIYQNFLDVPVITVKERGIGSTLPAGTYSYILILEWTDSNGNVHRSSPSFAVSITKATTQDITITKSIYLTNSIRLLPDLSDYDIVSKEVSFVLYRTTNGGTIYYRLVDGVYSNAGNGIVLPYNDSTLDSVLVAGEPLYLTGGVLENQLLPPAKYLLTANNRIFAISSEDENLIYYSQEKLTGESINFNSLLSIRTDVGKTIQDGKAKVLGVIDSKIVIFSNNSILYFYGDGPTQTGANNNFSTPQLVSNDVGIKDVRSIVNIPNGILFKSNKGIYLLNRAMQLQYIGQGVEAYNSETINGTALFGDNHKAFFITDNRTLVFDYLQEKWSTISFVKGVDMIQHDGTPTFIKNNLIYKLDSTVYKDDASYYSLKLVTSWLKMEGIQNFQRLYSIILVGEYYSAHTLTVKIYFDYDNTDYEEHTISPLATDKLYQYQILMNRQKCQSFKIEIFDNVSTGTGQAFKLTNISLMLGQKQGFRKISDSYKYVK